MVRLVPARSATSLKLIGWPDAASSSQARSTAAMSSGSAGIGVGDQGVDALYETAVTGGFHSPSPLFGVGEERIGVDALKAKDRQEGLIGAGSARRCSRKRMVPGRGCAGSSRPRDGP